MFRGLVNIWNYFSENVTALRMRDNCWGVTQRNEAMEKAASITKAILQSFIVFISILFVVNVSIYRNAVKREILHCRALNFLNRRA